jgi:membrane fusion protein, multidrug efflux system
MESETLQSAEPTSKWRRPRVWIIGVVLLALVALIIYQSFTFISAPPVRRGRFQDGGNQPVGVARVRRGDIRLSIQALGAVTPLTTVTVIPQISGVLMNVGFKEGQTVRKGQFLAQIDPRPYEIALEQDQAQLARDDATLKQAQMDLERYQTLAQQNSIARQTAEDQVWIVKQDQGTVDLDKAQIRTQQLNLVYCHIEAPADGRVGLRLVDPGNYLQAGSSTGIVVLTLLHPISVIFNVPEDTLPQIMARVHSGAVLPVKALDRANVTQLATGRFASIDTEVDQTTGTVKLRANFDNPDESLFPSQFVNVQMLLDTLHDVVTIPISAVQRGAPGTYVYLLKDDNTVSVHPITLGAQDGDLVAVQTGLEPGERVVTDGADRLRDGAKVVVPEAKDARPVVEGQPPNGRNRRRRGQSPSPNGPSQGAAATPEAEPAHAHPHAPAPAAPSSAPAPAPAQ